MSKNNKELEEWKCKQCNNVEFWMNTGDGPICVVLDEIFYNDCQNKQGELCRYYYNLGA